MRGIIIFIILIVVIAGAVYWWRTTDGNLMKNVDMLSKQNGMEIITESNVSYVEGASGYYARPKDDGNYPGVVMIHENRGLRPEIKQMAEELAKEGYLVLAVDLFEGKVVETQDEARAITAEFDQAKGIENMKSAVSYLKSKGATKIASLGWCFGGGQSLQLAMSGEQMNATVIYYGRLATTTDVLAPIDWPVLGIFGDQDQSISVESVRQFESALNSLGVNNEIYIYPGVGHAFANPSGMNYAPEQTKSAWGRTVVFLNRYLKS